MLGPIWANEHNEKTEEELAQYHPLSITDYKHIQMINNRDNYKTREYGAFEKVCPKRDRKEKGTEVFKRSVPFWSCCGHYYPLYFAVCLEPVTKIEKPKRTSQDQ